MLRYDTRMMDLDMRLRDMSHRYQVGLVEWHEKVVSRIENHFNVITRQALDAKEEIYLNLLLKYSSLKARLMTTQEKKEEEARIKELNEKKDFVLKEIEETNQSIRQIEAA